MMKFGSREGAWTNGSVTELGAWIAGERRIIGIGREDIEAYLGLSPLDAADMRSGERRLFVMDHVGQLIAAANRKAATSDSLGDVITIEAKDL